jgi:hypothetical protein
LFGQDVDPLAVAMCKVNGGLYAPWLSFPLPDTIFGTHVQPPLPATQLPDDAPLFRVDDHGQGLLFPL